MQQEALRAMLRDRLAGVFEHSITWEDDVWRADPLDVVEVHGNARHRYQALLAAVTAGSAPVHSRILLLHGQSGAGKTHLMRALRTFTHTGGKGYFGYAQMTPDVGNYAEYFLRRFVNALEKPYDPSEAGESGLRRLSNGLVNRSGALSPGTRELLKESAIEGEQLSRLVTRLADEIVGSAKFATQDLDVNVVRALLYLQRNDPRVDQRVRQFLYGRGLNDLSQPLVGALEPHEGQDRPFEIIEALGRIMRIVDGAALIMCIDQVEDLRFFDDPDERFQRAVRDLIQIANRVPSAIVLITCLDDFYAETRELLPQSFIDRIEKAGPIRLTESRTEEEARRIIERRLTDAYAREGLAGNEPRITEALGAGFFGELRGLSTRRLLEFAQSRWQQFLGLEVEAAIAPTPKADGGGEAALSIKARFDAYVQASHVEVPSEEPELLDILTRALLIAREEFVEAPEVEINPLDRIDDVAAADLIVRARGQATHAARLFICNRSNQGGGLKRQLERALEVGEGLNSVLIRTSEFPPGGKSATATLARKLTNSGGRRMVVPTYEWERMLQAQDFHARTRNESGYAAWLQAAKPLSSLPAIGELLRLQTASRAPANAARPSPAGAVSIGPARGERGFGLGQAWARITGGGEAPIPAPNDNAPFSAADGDDGDVVMALGDPITAPLQQLVEAPAEPPLASLPDFGLDAQRFVIGNAIEGHEPQCLTKQALRRHAAVLGGSGSGKTTLALSVVEQLLLRGTPVVLIDRKGDLCSYANPDVWRGTTGEPSERRGQRSELAASIDVAVYTPGRTSGRPINITLLPNGIAELPGHEQQLLANVSAAAIGEMLHLRHSATHQRMSGILAVALRVLGSKSRSEVRLSDLIRLLEDDDEELVELTSRMDPSGRARRDLMGQLDSLLHRNAALFDGQGEALRMESLLGLGPYARPNRTRLSIIYTGFLGDNENVLFWVSQFLSEALRFCQRNPSETLQAIIMFDEADLYIPAGSKPATKEPLESLLKRARSAGVGIMLATQSPGDLDYRSRDQITSWFIGRVREDTALKKLRAAFQSESGLDPARVLPNQTVGEFHLIQEGKVRAMKSRRSLVSADQVPFDRIEQLARETRKLEAQQLKLDFG